MFMNLLPKETAGSVFRFLCLMVTLSPSVAHAGFDWTPPAAPAVQQQAPVVHDATPPSASLSGPLTPEPDALPVPVGNVESTPISRAEPPAEPLVVENKKAVVAPAADPIPVADKMEPLPLPAPTPVASPAPAPIVRAAPVSAPVAAAPVPADSVEGFGKDIPLAMALHDIVPAQYAYAFAPRDIAGTKISWRGGKPWQVVLKDALAPVGLDMTLNGNALTIFSGQSAPALPPANPVAPPVVTSDLPVPTSGPAPDSTMVAARPAVSAPLPLVTPQDAQDQERIAAGNTRPVMTAMDLKATRKWQARPGATLRQTLESWAKEANVEVSWSTPYDYPINNAFYFDGQFSQAVDSLLSSYGGESPSPKGRLYPNLPEGPSVLMVN